MPITDTRAKVRDIARLRLAQGLSLSPTEIRRQLGRGSYSTICDELARLQRELAATAPTDGSGAAPQTAALPVDWVAAARVLGEQLDHERSERRAVECQLQDLRRQLQEVLLEKTALSLRVEQLQQEAAALNRTTAALRQAEERQAAEMRERENLLLEQFRALQHRMMLLVDSAHQAVASRMRELREQLEGTHMRESAFKQQISALREENARLRGQLAALQEPRAG